MSRFTILASLCAVLTTTGCSGRVSHEQAEPSGSSTTIVEVAPLDSRSPAPAEPRPDPQPPIIDQEGNVIVFGDVEHHHHLHIHETHEPPSVRVDVRVEVELMDDREQSQVTGVVVEPFGGFVLPPQGLKLAVNKGSPVDAFFSGVFKLLEAQSQESET